MAGLMWMGPRGYESWVPAPQAGGAFTPVGSANKMAFLNGGAAIRNSIASHQEYAMTWTPMARVKIQPILDISSGMRGPGLIYFSDPMALSQNMLPMAWAWPGQACYDAVPIAGLVRPSNIATPTNTFGFPAESARYQLLTGTTSTSVYLPIPTGFAAWVSANGVTTGPTVIVTPYTTGNVAGTTVTIPLRDATLGPLLATSFTGQGIELKLSGLGYITLAGLMVQILPNGTTPTSTSFISGLGNSGCEFEVAPTVTAYSTPEAVDLVGVTAKLVEVGSWL